MSADAAIDPRAAALLDFWFGEVDDSDAALAEKNKRWFGKSAQMDGEIRVRFADLREAAVSGRLDAWLTMPRTRLALVILGDQFSRNLFREDARAYAHDPLVRRWVDEGLCDGLDRGLRPIERVFFYLPLEHSESIADQQHAVALFTVLRDAVSPSLRARFDDYLVYALRHRDVIARFGRFPHRNAVLGRASTPEEIAFLAGPGSSF